MDGCYKAEFSFGGDLPSTLVSLGPLQLYGLDDGQLEYVNWHFGVVATRPAAVTFDSASSARFFIPRKVEEDNTISGDTDAIDKKVTATEDILISLQLKRPFRIHDTITITNS